MSTRGRSLSPRDRGGSDIEMRNASRTPEPRDTFGPKVVVISNLTKNVLVPHLKSIFGFYGDIRKVDLPTYRKSES